MKWIRLNLANAAICCGFLVGAAAGAATASLDAEVNPEAAWQNYLRNDTAIEPSYRFPHANCFRAAAATYGLPETLLLAVARGESDFEPTARSRANAHGVMQILWPTTANHLGIYRLTELYRAPISTPARVTCKSC